MSFTAIDSKAIDTIRVLAVSRRIEGKKCALCYGVLFVMEVEIKWIP